jgi:hypothetical protein
LLDLIDADYHGTSPATSQAGADAMYSAVLDGLYSTSTWPELGEALAADAGGDGSQIEAMSHTYNTSNSTNSNDVFNAVSCLDHPVTHQLSHYPRLATVLGRAAPVFGPLFAWGEVSCAVWPAAATRTPAPLHTPGLTPVVVVGTSGDPATPYAWAESVARRLPGARLVTFDGDDHVAYFYSSCVRQAVETYFVAGQLPAAGLVCTS